MFCTYTVEKYLSAGEMDIVKNCETWKILENERIFVSSDNVINVTGQTPRYRTLKRRDNHSIVFLVVFLKLDHNNRNQRRQSVSKVRWRVEFRRHCIQNETCIKRNL